jgi:hypothetical protein
LFGKGDVSHMLGEVPLVAFVVDCQVHPITERQLDGLRDDLNTGRTN